MSLSAQDRAHITVLYSGYQSSAGAVITTQNCTDTLAVSDRATKTLFKVLSDRQHISEASLLSALRQLIATDAQALSDSSLFSVVRQLIAADAQFPIADTSLFQAHRTRLAQDSQNPLSENLYRTLFKTLGDEAGASDSVARVLQKFLTDREDVFDNLVLTRLAILLAQDFQFPISDALLRTLLMFRTERQDVSETALFSLMRTLLVGDRENVSDSMGLTRIQFLLAQDLQSPISDTVARLLLKILGDRVDLTDSIENTVAGILIIFLVLSDSLAVSDSATREIRKMVTERQHLSDAALFSGIRLVLAQERLYPIVDQAGLSRLILLAVLDAMAASDASSLTAQRQLSLGDRQNVSDSTAQTLLRFILAADREEISDSATLSVIGRILSLLLLDNVAAQDAIGKTIFKMIGEPQLAADAVIKDLAKTLTERQGVSDTSLFSRLIFRLAQDTEQLTDTSAQALIRLILLALSDVLHVDDRASRVLLKVLAEQVEASDTLARAFVRFLLLGDQVTPSDSTKQQLIRLISATDTQFVIDVASRVLAKVLTDQALASDSTVRELRKLLLDNVDPTDSVTVNQVAFGLINLILSDNVAVSDAATKVLLKVLFDEAAVRDELDLQLAQSVRRFIDSMLSREDSPLGMEAGAEARRWLQSLREKADSTLGMKAGSEPNYKLVTRIVDPQAKDHGTKGIRK